VDINHHKTLYDLHQKVNSKDSKIGVRPAPEGELKDRRAGRRMGGGRRMWAWGGSWRTPLRACRTWRAPSLRACSPTRPRRAPAHSHFAWQEDVQRQTALCPSIGMQYGKIDRKELGLRVPCVRLNASFSQLGLFRPAWAASCHAPCCAAEELKTLRVSEGSPAACKKPWARRTACWSCTCPTSCARTSRLPTSSAQRRCPSSDVARVPAALRGHRAVAAASMLGAGVACLLRGCWALRCPERRPCV